MIRFLNHGGVFECSEKPSPPCWRPCRYASSQPAPGQGIAARKTWTWWDPPDIAELYGEYAGGNEVEIVLVNCGESAEAVLAFLEQNEYALPVAYDADGTIADAYGVVAIPRTVIFNRDGTVAADYTGMQDYDTFKSAIDGALEG